MDWLAGLAVEVCLFTPFYFLHFVKYAIAGMQRFKRKLLLTAWIRCWHACFDQTLLSCRRARLIPAEVKELKAQLPKPDAEGNRPSSPLDQQIAELEEVSLFYLSRCGCITMWHFCVYIAARLIIQALRVVQVS